MMTSPKAAISQLFGIAIKETKQYGVIVFYCHVIDYLLSCNSNYLIVISA